MRFPRSITKFAFLAAAILIAGSQPEGQRRRATRSSDLEAGTRGERVRVIVQADATGLPHLRLRHGHALRRELPGALVLEVSPSELDELSRNPSVAHISGDLPVRATMTIANKVTLASKVWQGSSGLLGLLGTSGYNGSGVGVAVVDSGIAAHSALGDRVIGRYNAVSFEPGNTGDPFGHGTHIAGAIAGSTTAAKYVTSAFAGGSAPAVRLIDVRVLGANGSGLTSDVIAGIDWAIENRRTYGIRVLNLSLGRPVTESAATDPLCRAVDRAVSNNIIVVASAGNYGQTAEGVPIMGGISSPGSCPNAITVGAVDTRGTADRRDDIVAPYSSRGPTRFDFAVKPDVVAPGHRIVSLEANGSLFSRTYPSWHVAGTGKNAYFRLSGSSMATAVVSGGVALLVDADPGLTAGQAKFALQLGARFVPDAGLVGGGAGSVDFEASLRMIKQGLLDSLLTSLTNLLGLSSGASYRDTGTLIERAYDGSGIRLLGLLDLGGLLGGADSADYGVLNLLGLTNPLASTPPNYLVWGERAEWTNSYYIIWGTTMQSPEGEYIIWGTSDDGEYIIWGTGTNGDEGR